MSRSPFSDVIFSDLSSGFENHLPNSVWVPRAPLRNMLHCIHLPKKASVVLRDNCHHLLKRVVLLQNICIFRYFTSRILNPNLRYKGVTEKAPQLSENKYCVMKQYTVLNTFCLQLTIFKRNKKYLPSHADLIHNFSLLSDIKCDMKNRIELYKNSKSEFTSSDIFCRYLNSMYIIQKDLKS